MVVNAGKVIEYESPFKLLALSSNSNNVDNTTEFAKLVKNTGE